MVNVLSALGKVLIVIGVITAVVGGVLVADPGVASRTMSFRHARQVAFGTYYLRPMDVKSFSFSVPSDATSAYLAVDVRVLEGNDVGLLVTCGSTLFHEKTTGGIHDIQLQPGCRGELTLSNTFSLVTSKKVRVDAVLHYTTVEANTSDVQNLGAMLLVGGLTVTVLGVLVIGVGRLRKKRAAASLSPAAPAEAQ